MAAPEQSDPRETGEAEPSIPVGTDPIAEMASADATDPSVQHADQVTAAIVPPSDDDDPTSEETHDMAFPTSVNDQITDSVTQSGMKVLGDAPALALGGLYQAAAHAAGLAAANAVSNQQNTSSLSLAVTTRCVATLLGSAPTAA